MKYSLLSNESNEYDNTGIFDKKDVFCGVLTLRRLLRMSLGDKFTSGYRGINAFNSGVIKLLVARENDWIEEKLSAILT